MLRAWLEFSELIRRATSALGIEVEASSALVENAVVEFIGCFQSLADAAKVQIDHVETLVALAPGAEAAHGSGGAQRGSPPHTDAHAGAEDRATAMRDVLSRARRDSEEVWNCITRLITTAQFQDRTRQHLAHVRTTLAMLAAASQAIQRQTQGQFADLGWNGNLEDSVQRRALEGHTIAELCEHFLRLLLPPSQHAAPDSKAEPSIDLF